MRSILLVTLLFLASDSNILRAQESSTRPNVLFLFADDMRADTISALGNTEIQTPNLDRLVRSGVAFQRAYMQGARNGATCVPSRAMLLSGKSLFRIDEKLRRDPSWPSAFAKAGYTTFLTGKWHNTPESIPLCFQNARSVFVGGMTNPMRAPLSNLVDGRMTKAEILPKHACDSFSEEAITFIRTQKENPFLCYVAFDAPHDPHIVPENFPIHYQPNKLSLPGNYLPQHPFNNGEMAIRDERLLPWPRTPEAIRQMKADYYRYISYLDSQVGRILDALAASEHEKNTIIVFSADSGVSLGSHGLLGKQSLYEHALRVPLIISGPGIAAGQSSQAMCYLFDVFPTLGKLCGVPAPSSSEGIEFGAVLKDTSKPARKEMMFAYMNVQRAVRDSRWKLIRYPQIDKTQLFDLTSDPEEINNLAELPEQQMRVAELMALLKKEQIRYSDPSPLQVAEPISPDWIPPKNFPKKP